ncbi:MAG: enoyl-CoA hydratase/isomerase family protein [Phycisphaerales bacterium]|nr:enoyl-CoA hydratase/isomerase family protein [Phycisphaerales bacterium]
MEPSLLIERERLITTLTLNAPARRNALSSAMFDELEGALDSLDRQPAVVVHLRALGSAFCSGFDLSECATNHAALSKMIERLALCLCRIRSSSAVWVAEVQGAALAGGCALVSACDIVLASREATFGYPVHRIGVSPAVSLPTLTQSAGWGGARLLTLLGATVSAARAAEVGLVHHLSDDAAALVLVAKSHVQSISGHAPRALAHTKQWLNAADGSTDPHSIIQATLVSTQTCESAECVVLLRCPERGRHPS